MNTFTNQKLILSLIKDDLIHSKLVNNLIDTGINVSHYHLHLGNIIFELLGFKEDHYSDKVYDLYIELQKKARLINITISTTALDELALARRRGPSSPLRAIAHARALVDVSHP